MYLEWCVCLGMIGQTVVGTQYYIHISDDRAQLVWQAET
jgi:hypothetical protein